MARRFSLSNGECLVHADKIDGIIAGETEMQWISSGRPADTMNGYRRNRTGPWPLNDSLKRRSKLSRAGDSQSAVPMDGLSWSSLDSQINNADFRADRSIASFPIDMTLDMFAFFV
jgi:hypothetical protein